MPLSISPASAYVASAMSRLADCVNLRRPLTFLRSESRGIHVQPSTSTVYLCEETLGCVSEQTLDVIAAHEVGHLFECARLWRHLAGRRSVGLTLLALTLAVMGHTTLAECVGFAGLLALNEDGRVPRTLADARTEVFADAFACVYVTDFVGWQAAVDEYGKAMSSLPNDDVLVYRRVMLNILSRKGALTRVLELGPDALSQYEQAGALIEERVFSRLGAPWPNKPASGKRAHAQPDSSVAERVGSQI